VEDGEKDEESDGFNKDPDIQDASFATDDERPDKYSMLQAETRKTRQDPIVKILARRPTCKYLQRQSEPVVPIRKSSFDAGKSKQIAARAKRRFHYQTKSAQSLGPGELNLPFIKQKFL
jgi:hypothetical protein